MQILRIFLVLIFSLTLFTSCSVDELEDNTPQTEVEDLQANGDGENETDKDKGSQGG